MHNLLYAFIFSKINILRQKVDMYTLSECGQKEENALHTVKYYKVPKGLNTPQRYLHSHVSCNIVHNSQDRELA